MSELVDHLAHLTGFRDRDVLDVTLVGAFKDLLRPVSVAIYRTVADASGERWLTRARLAREDVAATADSAWVDLDLLPALDEHPLRRECLRSQEVQCTVGPPHVSLFPVATDREVVGVLEIETGQPMSADDQRLVGSILRIYRNFQGLLDYSERDTLTGLLNRKTFDDAFYKTCAASAEGQVSAEARREARRGMKAYLGIIDIDHFKRVNDNHGHLIGDEVLLLLSRLMRASFRFHDRLYRFGGEEFVVLLRCASDSHARRAFERLRAATERYAFPQVGRITVSIGFTDVRMGDNPSVAFERADKAVYWAKAHGRNLVAEHAVLVARGELLEGQKTGDVELF